VCCAGLDKPDVQRVTARINLVARQRCEHSTVGFALMRTVIKATLWDMRVEFWKPSFDFFAFKM
jgi:hypothetical protein